MYFCCRVCVSLQHEPLLLQQRTGMLAKARRWTQRPAFSTRLLGAWPLLGIVPPGARSQNYLTSWLHSVGLAAYANEGLEGSASQGAGHNCQAGRLGPPRHRSCPAPAWFEKLRQMLNGSGPEPSWTPSCCVGFAAAAFAFTAEPQGSSCRPRA